MKSASLLLAASVLTMLAGNVQATPLPEFQLGTSKVVYGDNQVSTQGTEVWGGSNGGMNNGNTQFTLSNGVTFNSIYSNSNFVSSSNVVYPVFGPSGFISYPSSLGILVDQDGAAYGNQAASNIPAVGYSDQGLNGALSYSPSTSGSLFLYINGLTPNHVYTLQFFADMTNTANTNGNPGPTGDSGTETVTPATGYFNGFDSAAASTLSWGQIPDPAHPGQFLTKGGESLTETLLAPANGQTFTLFSPSGGTSYATLDAVVIRDVTDVPEPTTYAMMTAGLAVLGFCIRRKNSLLK